MDDAKETMTRIEAAAYLTTKGLNIGPHTLAKYASEKKGPPFSKPTTGHHTAYAKADLDAFLAGDHKRGPKNKGGRPRKGDDLLRVLDEFLPMVERVVLGQGTFKDGVQFGQTFDRLKHAMRQRRNGNGAEG